MEIPCKYYNGAGIFHEAMMNKTSVELSLCLEVTRYFSGVCSKVQPLWYGYCRYTPVSMISVIITNLVFVLYIYFFLLCPVPILTFQFGLVISPSPARTLPLKVIQVYIHYLRGGLQSSLPNVNSFNGVSFYCSVLLIV